MKEENTDYRYNDKNIIFLRNNIKKILDNGRATVLIDHANLEFSLRKLQFRFDYEVFHNEIKKLTNLRGMYCFISVFPNDNKRGKFVSFLEYNGYRVIKKEAKGLTSSEEEMSHMSLDYSFDESSWKDNDNPRKVKGNVDVELTIYALEYCRLSDHIILMSGDGDFRMLIEQLQKNGKEVTVISTAQTQPPIIADELRRQADNFLDLDKYRLLFEKL